MTDFDVAYLRRMTGTADIFPATPANGLTREQRDRLEIVWDVATEVWKDEEAAFDFLNRRHAMLEDRRPVDVTVLSEEGAQSVQAILRRLQFGTAA